MATARARIRRRQLAAITVVIGVIAPVFNVLTDEASLGSALQGALDSVLISLLVGGYLLFVRDGWGRAWFRRLGFWTDLALSSAIVLALFLVGRAAGLTATSLRPERFLTSFTDRHLLYGVPFFAVLAVTVQFVLQMNRVIGANVLGYFMAGVRLRRAAGASRAAAAGGGDAVRGARAAGQGGAGDGLQPDRARAYSTVTVPRPYQPSGSRPWMARRIAGRPVRGSSSARRRR
jgi:hypothetical protein